MMMMLLLLLQAVSSSLPVLTLTMGVGWHGGSCRDDNGFLGASDIVAAVDKVT